MSEDNVKKFVIEYRKGLLNLKNSHTSNLGIGFYEVFYKNFKLIIVISAILYLIVGPALIINSNYNLLMIVGVIFMGLFEAIFFITYGKLKIRIIRELDVNGDEVKIEDNKGDQYTTKIDQISLIAVDQVLGDWWMLMKAGNKYYYIKYDCEAVKYLKNQDKTKNYMYLIALIFIILWILLVYLLILAL